MIELSFTVQGAPMGAVRQTRRDAWKPSPAVQRYRVWRDVVRAAYKSARNRTREPLPPVDLAPDELHLIAYFPIPPSWSQKKQMAMIGKPHRSAPDGDNASKGVADSIFKQDGRIHFWTCRKRYNDGKGPRLEVLMIWEDSEKSS